MKSDPEEKPKFRLDHGMTRMVLFQRDTCWLAISLEQRGFTMKR